MKILLIAAHGSRKKESAKEVAALAQKLGANPKSGFDRVDYGFLQFSPPLVPEVIADAVAKGATQIVIFPFFISAGSHILTDLPELAEAAAKEYPDVAFTITRHLGIAPGIEDVILGEVDRHMQAGRDGEK